jgi:mRNA m6A methyltransferase non-catalytic subunit
MATVTATANDLFAQHLVLISRIKESQKAHRRKLRSLPSPPHSILNLPTISTPKPSPPPSPPSSPLLLPRRKPPRTDLQPPKRARATHYENYVPEEETIRNDYSQRYVDGGEWPQDWVLGAEPERRFEEFVNLLIHFLISQNAPTARMCKSSMHKPFVDFRPALRAYADHFCAPSGIPSSSACSHLRKYP